jgi:protein required for attachment to host cells
MNKIVLPHDAWVFVGDGKKALFLRNAGDEKSVNLKAERVYAEDNPPTREQGTDHPGRAFKRAGTNQRGSVEMTDWHELQKHHFAQHTAAAMEQIVRDRNVKTFVIVAPARTLSDLRRSLHPDVKSRILAEISKDLTKHTIAEIEKHLAA